MLDVVSTAIHGGVAAVNVWDKPLAGAVARKSALIPLLATLSRMDSKTFKAYGLAQTSLSKINNVYASSTA